jgi:hypothetical protein
MDEIVEFVLEVLELCCASGGMLGRQSSHGKQEC